MLNKKGIPYGSQVSIDLCTTFINTAIHTWHYLENGIKTGIEFEEGTLTDINLLEIQIKHPKEVKTVKFNRIIEGTITGADWEWWIGAKSGWLGLLIQAKKLNSQSLTYDKLDYSNVHGLQVDMLIKDAKKNGLIPLYCLYNYWDINKLPIQWNCGTYGTLKELQGCTLTSAKEVKNLISANDKSLQSISSRALPWHCLVCCKGYSGPDADITQRAFGILQQFWHISSEIRNSNQLPGYVLNILHGENVTEIPTEISHLIIMTEGIL